MADIRACFSCGRDVFDGGWICRKCGTSAAPTHRGVDMASMIGLHGTLSARDFGHSRLTSARDHPLPTPKWMAYKMSGFGGLFVPELVTHHDAAGGVVMCPLGDFCPNTWSVRMIPEDGVLFDTRDECVGHCDAANSGNRQLTTVRL
jgi:hypothetical protein